MRTFAKIPYYQFRTLSVRWTEQDLDNAFGIREDRRTPQKKTETNVPEVDDIILDMANPLTNPLHPMSPYRRGEVSTHSLIDNTWSSSSSYSSIEYGGSDFGDSGGGGD